jgi:hypothetical protein
MAELLAEFPTPVASRDGVFYTARACGAKAADALWHGWVEFRPVDGGPSICSPRETTQPNRVDAEYWGGGLTPVYLEGALQRALDGPPPAAAVRHERSPFVGVRDAALDPFSVYEKGELLLRKQLGALSAWHLVNIALVYDLTDERVESLNERSAGYLIDLIVRRVREEQKVRGR